MIARADSRFVLLAKHKLDGPPPPDFDCEREAQNRFLLEQAWPDQGQRLSVTYLYRAGGSLAGFMAVCMDAVILGTREKPAAVHYKHIGALKLAQLGVDHAFHGQGLGTLIVFDAVNLALELSQQVGCRYVTVDAQPDLVGWYLDLGFEVNKAMQKQRIAAAAGRDPATVPVSMYFDLREV